MPVDNYSRQKSAVVDELMMCKSLILGRHQWSMEHLGIGIYFHSLATVSISAEDCKLR